MLKAPTIEQLAQTGSNWNIDNSLVSNSKFRETSFLKSHDRVILENETLLVVAEMPGTRSDKPIVRFFTPGEKGQHFLNLFLDNDFQVVDYNNNYIHIILEQQRFEQQRDEVRFIKKEGPVPTAEELATNWAAHALVGSLDNGFVRTVYSALGLPEARLIREEKQGLDRILELRRKATASIQTRTSFPPAGNTESTN